jgi:hypothetical protein
VHVPRVEASAASAASKVTPGGVGLEAEAGASEHEIASVTGHQSLEEIERYTRAAERKRLADRAMKKFKT